MSKRTLLVWPNPFHALNHDGHPQGVLPYEPEGNGITSFDDRRFVGAQLKAEILQKFPLGDARQAVQRTWFEYSEEAVRVPETDYYKKAIMGGEIFAADEVTAKRCGITQSFLEAGELLERAREEAIGAWKILGHEEHIGDDDETVVPDELSKFAFGPMPQAVEVREKVAKALEEEEKKKVDAAEKAAASAKKSAEDAAKEAAKKAAQSQSPRGGE